MAGKKGEKVNTGLSPVFIKLWTVSRMGWLAEKI